MSANDKWIRHDVSLSMAGSAGTRARCKCGWTATFWSSVDADTLAREHMLVLNAAAHLMGNHEVRAFLKQILSEIIEEQGGPR